MLKNTERPLEYSPVLKPTVAIAMAERKKQCFRYGLKFDMLRSDIGSH